MVGSSYYWVSLISVYLLGLKNLPCYLFTKIYLGKDIRASDQSIDVGMWPLIELNKKKGVFIKMIPTSWNKNL